jgi:hypothetical protein
MRRLPGVYFMTAPWFARAGQISAGVILKATARCCLGLQSEQSEKQFPEIFQRFVPHGRSSVFVLNPLNPAKPLASRRRTERRGAQSWMLARRTRAVRARFLPCCKGLCRAVRQLRAHQRIRRPQQGIETVLSSPQTTARLLLQTRCWAQVTTPPIQAEQRLSRVDRQRSGHGSEATR